VIALSAGAVLVVLAVVAVEVVERQARASAPPRPAALPVDRELAVVRVQLTRVIALAREWAPPVELAYVLTVAAEDVFRPDPPSLVDLRAWGVTGTDGQR
jgi:hypothetical protein